MSAIARLSISGVLVLSLGGLLGCSSDEAQGRNPGSGGSGSGSGGSNSGGGNSSGGPKSGGGIIVPGSVSTTCGNKQLDTGENCDDGNTTDGDGCNRICQVEADYDCSVVGEPCRYSAACGDGLLATTEVCDDKNAQDGDGCSADCKTVEPGFQCRVPGSRCVPLCGDGMVIGGENCDDSNTTADDGCSPTCLVEPGWDCTTLPCKKSVCGNEMVEAGETCDAGMSNGLFFGDGSGCSKTCTKEPTCRDSAGKTTACATPCGDGNIDPNEKCDDGNQVAGDGCSPTCEEEPGFMCGKEVKKDTVACTTGAGECLVLPVTYRDFDGANVATGHPDFFFYGATSGGAATTCIPNASGANLLPQQENGTCPPTDATDPCKGLVNATLGTDGKPVLGTTTTCACTFTDWDGTGILNNVATAQTCSSGAASPRFVRNVMVKVIQSADTFKEWYSDSMKSTKVLGTLELAAQQDGTYQFSSSGGRTVYDDIHDIWLASKNLPTTVGAATSLSSGFFPLEESTRPKLCNLWPYWGAGLGPTTAMCTAGMGNPIGQQWNPRGWNSGQAAPQAGEALGTGIAPVTGTPRNFYFTSEVRYLFRFAGGETLSFFGDDDVWVFINGKLVLDLGAPHERMRGNVTLDATGNTAAWTTSVQSVTTGMDLPLPGAAGSGMVTGLGLEVGKTYEIAIFHADRHPRESNYQLTLSGFSTERSTCVPRCGDGVQAASEECDNGDQNMDGVYGGCTTQCKVGPFCGDGTVDEVGGEQCDLGRMNGVDAAHNGMGCTSSCKFPPRCGDTVIDTAFGEQCDLGDQNSPTGVCTDKCTFPVR